VTAVPRSLAVDQPDTGRALLATAFPPAADHLRSLKIAYDLSLLYSLPHQAA